MYGLGSFLSATVVTTTTFLLIHSLSEVPELSAEDYSKSGVDFAAVSTTLWHAHDQEVAAEPPASLFKTAHHTPAWVTRSIGLIRALKGGIPRGMLWRNQLVRPFQVICSGDRGYQLVLSSSPYGLRVLRLATKEVADPDGAAVTLLDPVRA